MISDWQYLSAARKGDEKSWDFIFQKYNKSLLRMAGLITGSMDTAQDIVQETFIRLFKTRIKHQKGNFKTYITTITYRLALKEKSRLQRFRDLNEEHIPESLNSPDKKQTEEENQKLIFRTIASLPENQRDILVLRYYNDFSYETISEVTGIPIGTVKSRIFYAVKSCREILKEKGVFE